MQFAHTLGEVLLYVVALPLFAFQSIEALQALIEITAEIAKLGK
ncbi:MULTISPECIES: hypothetical protein [Aneurinibacillus]|jgi:hypothetical protein|uniref:Uncharacterized protein n=1 Tax=Aneurinibacillus danicus TaxID=267746 RepID=A0A511V9I6_9BACL|nr:MULTISPECIES: hypothetical protein [Aneurinibacillus]GEN35570.1 hypothetical protein ADA01nite_30300 [Aneurinibacillus danicus]